MVNDGRNAFLSAPLVTSLEGGVPIVVDGQVVGAVGVSGVKADHKPSFLFESSEDASAKVSLGTFLSLKADPELHAQLLPLINRKPFRRHAFRV